MLAELIKTILDWVRDRVGVHEPSPSVFVSHKTSSDGQCQLILLFDENGDAIPGIVRLWQLSHVEATHDFYLILIDIAQCKSEGLLTPEDESSGIRWRRSLESKVRLEIEKQEDINASHVWLVACATKTPLFERGSRKFRHVDAVACYCVNLVPDEARVYLGQQSRLAVVVTEVIAHHILEMKSSEHWAWQALVLAFPWLQQLQSVARAATKRKDFYLRPPKSHDATGDRKAGSKKKKNLS